MVSIAYRIITGSQYYVNTPEALADGREGAQIEHPLHCVSFLAIFESQHNLCLIKYKQKDARLTSVSGHKAGNPLTILFYRLYMDCSGLETSLRLLPIPA
jgi:hypothetical protein